MSGMGVAMMGTAMAEGPARAMDAAQRAISSPLLEDASVNGAKGVIINVTGGPDMSLMEVNEALTLIQEAAHAEANIIFGAVVDPALEGRVKITVIATGFERAAALRSSPAEAPKQTPVDLQSYGAPVAKQGTAKPAVESASSRMTIARRPGLEMPGTAQRLAMGGAGTVKKAESGLRGDVDSTLELEVPAFLRRSEG
jgi:cell division protein FtsZ